MQSSYPPLTRRRDTTVKHTIADQELTISDMRSVYHADVVRVEDATKIKATAESVSKNLMTSEGTSRQSRDILAGMGVKTKTL